MHMWKRLENSSAGSWVHQQKTLDRKALDQAYEDAKDEKIKQDKENNKLDGQRVKEFLEEVPDVAENEEEDDDADYFAKILKSSNQNRSEFPLAPMGVLAPVSAHAGNFPARVSAESISPNFPILWSK